MYVRLTGSGSHDLADRCTRTASSALAGEVNATSPSTPAVLRPALRCVTCRTLISVFDQLRSIIFCRFRAMAQSCSRTALKIRCRVRRTCSSCVTSFKHIQKLKEFYLDTPIGLVELTCQNTLRTIYEAKNSSENFDHTTIFKTLRKQEYLDIIKSHYGYLPEVPNTLLFKRCLELAKRVDIATFQRLAFEKLKERKLKCQTLLESEQTPYELKHICYIMDLSKNEYHYLYRFLNKVVANVSSLS
jgi:hypothetical protein